MQNAAARPAAIHLRPDDNLAVAARSLRRGERLEIAAREVTLLEPVNLGHKFALVEIPSGQPLRKYGQIIGFASQNIPAGAHIHVHNCSAQAFERDYAFATAAPPTPVAAEKRTFEGYVRGDGRVGTRNYIAIISTVNCSASTSKYIAQRVTNEVLRDFPNVDGVIPITHKGGCGLQYDGADHHQLDRTLAGFARHPNVGGYIIVGLGCEVGQASHLIQSQKLVQVEGLSGRAGSSGGAPAAPPSITIQDSGGISRTIEAGVRAVHEILPRVNAARRTTVPASKLILGTNCGGSDGNSGITANPALGVASDLVVGQGGTTILGETPEIYGAEHLLTRRAVSRSVGEALVERIKWWEWYTGVFGAEINNNPSPGNKDGGLTTIYEKSLGAIAKAGSTALTAVYRYAEPVTQPGFVVMDTPGFDPVSMTGIVAGGANVCVFTTGRGSVYGCKPSPCIKVATNTPLYERMTEDMDLDAGPILAGVPLEEVGRRLFEMILTVASGQKTKSELAGVGEEEFAPWSIGPTL
jgi:altronate hydrolase